MPVRPPAIRVFRCVNPECTFEQEGRQWEVVYDPELGPKKQSACPACTSFGEHVPANQVQAQPDVEVK